MKKKKVKVKSKTEGGAVNDSRQAPPEVDPESDSRTWRYAWEKAWRPGLKVKW